MVTEFVTSIVTGPYNVTLYLVNITAIFHKTSFFGNPKYTFKIVHLSRYVLINPILPKYFNILFILFKILAYKTGLSNLLVVKI